MATDTTNNPDSADDTSNSNPGVIETDSLEGPSGSANTSAPTGANSSGPKGPSRLRKFTHKFNIYLLLFILILVISGGILAISAFSAKTSQEPKIASQSLSAGTLKQLASTDATVGDPKQVLNVQSNAVFAGKVLIRDSLDVAGQIHVSGSLTLPGITVSGESSFDSVSVTKALTIGGDESILGQLTVKKNFSVSGNGTFGGSLTAPQIATSNLQVLGDLNLTSHIVAGGATPGQSYGAVLGNGGTASVSGSDTTGTVNINIGSSPASNGCFITINFNKRFNNTPHVVITPTNSNAAGSSYYVNRSSASFSICTTSTPPAGSMSFDYIVLG